MLKIDFTNSFFFRQFNCLFFNGNMRYPLIIASSTVELVEASVLAAMNVGKICATETKTRVRFGHFQPCVRR